MNWQSKWVCVECKAEAVINSLGVFLCNKCYWLSLQKPQKQLSLKEAKAKQKEIDAWNKGYPNENRHHAGETTPSKKRRISRISGS